MGGRGSAGSTWSGNIFAPKLQELSDSEKQVAWAKDIIAGAYRNLQLIQKEMNRKFPDGGWASNIHDTVEDRDLVEVKNFIDDALSQPQFSKAKTVIEKRTAFEYKHLLGLAQELHKNQQKWDKKKHDWVDRRR